MLERLRDKLLISPEHITPTREDMQVVGAFNPGAIDMGDHTIVLLRVAEAPREQHDGHRLLPEWCESGEGIEIHKVSEDQIEPIDPRVVQLRATGMKRLTFTSHLRAYRLPRDLCDAAFEFSEQTEIARFIPNGNMECFGVEDPRITCIDGRYYVTYVSVSEHGACTSLAVTDDFVTYERIGVIFPPENKDVTLFDRKVGECYVALHRPNPSTYFSSPEMWLAYSDNLRDYGGHIPLFGGITNVPRTLPEIPANSPPDTQDTKKPNVLSDERSWQVGRVGGGCVPMWTERGWLTIYHGNAKRPNSPKSDVGTYSAGILLLDANDPSKIIARTPEPFMIPEKDFEKQGFVNDVVFPTALLDRGDRWLIVYGASDTHTAAVEYDKQAMWALLK